MSYCQQYHVTNNPYNYNSQYEDHDDDGGGLDIRRYHKRNNVHVRHEDAMGISNVTLPQLTTPTIRNHRIPNHHSQQCMQH
mmetsp:Transcript_23518/g.49749  ORF Transcript_23518/g.49749 Transcript_23518/m.49749 type:complete len:81 (+) Transcript_23518:653-895(+)